MGENERLKNASVRKNVGGFFNQPLCEYGFAYGLRSEMCQFSKNCFCESHGQGKETHLV